MESQSVEVLLSEAVLASHNAWRYFMRLEDTQAMQQVTQVIDQLQQIVGQVDYLLQRGIESQSVEGVFQLFPVLLAAMEQKNGLDLADLLEYELSPQLEKWLQILALNGGSNYV